LTADYRTIDTRACGGLAFIARKNPHERLSRQEAGSWALSLNLAPSIVYQGLTNRRITTAVFWTGADRTEYFSMVFGRIAFVSIKTIFRILLV
jgi:hypothetical protein